ncbi:MAG TPA: transglutaminase domain-containing protein [Burkholderiales bacterium]|nr:transglutaminase domain-containing protein [Burkholderiales bacterium]
MSLPPLVLAAALAFWGWRSGNYASGVLLALLLEGARYLRLRFELSYLDFTRVAQLCTVIFIGLLGYLFASVEPPRTARAVLTTMLWLPAVLAPLVIAQRLSTGGLLPLSALFRYLRKMRERDPDYRETELDFAPIYCAICLVAAGIPNQRDVFYYTGVVLIGCWALAGARPDHARLAPRVITLVAAIVLGYAGQAGLSRAQAALEDWVSDWYLSGMDSNPYQSRTDLGSVGRLKTDESIVLRVYPQAHGDAPPKLLHRSSFTTLEGNTWVARRAPMSELQPLADGTSWPITAGRGEHRTRIFTRLENGKAVLALPEGTVRLEDAAALLMRRNALGAVQAEFGGDWAPYTASSTETSADYASPTDEDLLLPRQERALVEGVAAKLGLHALAPREAVARIHEHLAGFSYSTYREGSILPGRTPLEDFLLHSKSGHCEYFAAATTLLLRAAGVPARYATGFSVQEYSKLENAYIVRARHAHAWARAYVDGRWIDVDNTPPSWAEEEASRAPFWEGFADLLRWAQFRFTQGGPLQFGVGGAAVLIVLLAYFVWRLFRGKRAAARLAALPGARRYAGADSEFYAVEARLAPRAPHESLGDWLARIAPTLDGAARDALAQLVPLHYRYRFDPQGIDASERRALRAQSLALAARLESANG